MCQISSKYKENGKCKFCFCVSQTGPHVALCIRVNIYLKNVYDFITDTDIDWVDLADDIRHEYFVVDNLRPSHGYKFRVLARNKFGWSIPSIPSPIVMTPSSGASKAEFYDALQALQVSTGIS